MILGADDSESSIWIQKTSNRKAVLNEQWITIFLADPKKENCDIYTKISNILQKHKKSERNGCRRFWVFCLFRLDLSYRDLLSNIWFYKISLGIFQPPIRITHCGHVFCETCLLNMTRRGQRWHCPNCRSQHNCGVSSLTRNYHLEKLVQKFKETQLSKLQLNTGNKFGACKRHDREIEYRK